MTYKVLFAMTAQLDWEIEQMDVKTAFLYGILDEDVYVEMPTGYFEKDLVCKLNKVLYDLKQAPRKWFRTLTKFLVSLNYHVIPKNSSVYCNPKTGMFVAIYVNDLLIFEVNKTAIQELKDQLSKRFKMIGLKSVTYYLSLKVVRNRFKSHHSSQSKDVSAKDSEESKYDEPSR